MLYINYSLSPLIDRCFPTRNSTVSGATVAALTPISLGISIDNVWSIIHYNTISAYERKVIIDRVIDSSGRADHLVINIQGLSDKLIEDFAISYDAAMRFQNDLIHALPGHECSAATLMPDSDWISRRMHLSLEDKLTNEIVSRDDLQRSLPFDTENSNINAILLAEASHMPGFGKISATISNFSTSSKKLDFYWDFISSSKLIYDVYNDLLKFDIIRSNNEHDIKKFIIKMISYPSHHDLSKLDYDLVHSREIIATNIYSDWDK
jgi:hypothetical protein